MTEPHEAPASPGARERFISALKGAYPGGELLADHVDDGPWYGVLLPMSATGPDLACRAVAAWPGRGVIQYTGHSWPELVHVHVVPQLVHDLLVFFGEMGHSEWTMRVDAAYRFGPYDSEPADADLIRDLRCVIDADLDQGALDDLSQRFDLASLTSLLIPLIGGLSLESRGNPDDELPRIVTAVRDSTE
jgi:hypothetical protein